MYRVIDKISGCVYVYEDRDDAEEMVSSLLQKYHAVTLEILGRDYIIKA